MYITETSDGGRVRDLENALFDLQLCRLLIRIRLAHYIELDKSPSSITILFVEFLLRSLPHHACRIEEIPLSH